MTDIVKAEALFHFFDLNLTPYNDSKTLVNANQILKDTAHHIYDSLRTGNKAIVIDRHEGSTTRSERRLVITQFAYSLPDKKYKGKIRLLRDKDLPAFLKKEDYSEVDFDKIKEEYFVAETTSFYIDVERGFPIVACQFNSNGPRISDVEYYLRHVCKKIKSAKKVEALIHMKHTVGEVLGSIQEVLKFDMKISPDLLKYLNPDAKESFFNNMNGLSGSIDPFFLRIEAFFQIQGSDKKAKNGKSLAFIKRLLNQIVKGGEETIENFEEFNLKYMKTGGEVAEFVLVKDREEMKVLYLNTRELAAAAVAQFDQYLDKKYGSKVGA